MVPDRNSGTEVHGVIAMRKTKINLHRNVAFTLILVCLLVGTFVSVLDFGFVPIVKASLEDEVFSDDFETGDLINWSGNDTEGDGEISVTSLVNRTGTYSMNITSPAGAGSARAYKTLESTYQYVEFEFYVRFNRLPADGKKWQLVEVRDDSTTIFKVNFKNWTGNQVYYFSIWRYFPASAENNGDQITGIQTDVWYQIIIQFKRHATSGEYLLWFNGTQTNSAYTGLDTTGTDGVKTLKLGAYYPSEESAFSVFYDDVKLTAAYSITGLVGTSTVEAYAPVDFSCYVETQSGNLSGYIFGTDNSGSDQNDTWVAFDAGLTESWMNVSKARLNETFGVEVGYQYWINNTNGDWGTSGVQTFVTQQNDESLYEVGFETGDLSRVAATTSSPANITASTTNPFWGNYSVYMNSSAGGGDGRARIYPIGIDDKTSAYMRGYFMVPSWKSYIQILRFAGHVNDVYTYQGRVVISSSYVMLQMPVGASGDPDFTYDTTLETNRWYSIELAQLNCNTTEGEFYVWLDGEEVISVTDVDLTNATTPQNISTFVWGVVLLGSTEDVQELYMDGLVLSESRIGTQPFQNGIFWIRNNEYRTDGNHYINDTSASSLITAHEWFSDNSTLRSEYTNTSSAENATTYVYWETMNSSIKIEFSNETLVNAEDYYNVTTKLITIPFIYESDIIISVYNAEEAEDTGQEDIYIPVSRQGYSTMTLYMRSDTWTVHEELGYKLWTTNTLFDDNVESTSDTLEDFYVSLRLWRVDESGQTLLTTDIANVTQSGLTAGTLLNTTYTLPNELDLGYSDALQVDLLFSWESGGGTVTKATFITDILNSNKINNNTWTVYYYIAVTNDSGTYSYTFYYGDSSHESKIVNIQFGILDPWGKGLMQLGEGDFIGFIINPYSYHLTQELFFGIFAMLIIVPAYNRYRDIRPVMVLSLLFGGVGGFLTLLVPAIALRISFLFLAIGLGIVLYKLLR